MLSISFGSFLGIISILPSIQPNQFRGMCERGQNFGIMLQPFICFLPGISNGDIPLIYFFFPPPINLTPVEKSKSGGPVMVPMPLPPYPVLTSRRPQTTTEVTTTTDNGVTNSIETETTTTTVNEIPTTIQMTTTTQMTTSTQLTTTTETVATTSTTEGSTTSTTAGDDSY